MYIKIGVLITIIRLVKVWWLGQSSSLTIAAGLNARWQSSEIRQCRLKGGARYVNLWESIHRDTIIFNSSQ